MPSRQLGEEQRRQKERLEQRNQGRNPPRVPESTRRPVGSKAGDLWRDWNRVVIGSDLKGVLWLLGGE